LDNDDDDDDDCCFISVLTKQSQINWLQIEKNKDDHFDNTIQTLLTYSATASNLKQYKHLILFKLMSALPWLFNSHKSIPMYWSTASFAEPSPISR